MRIIKIRSDQIKADDFIAWLSACTDSWMEIWLCCSIKWVREKSGEKWTASCENMNYCTRIWIYPDIQKLYSPIFSLWDYKNRKSVDSPEVFPFFKVLGYFLGWCLKS